jgi:hypothetical protein
MMKRISVVGLFALLSTMPAFNAPAEQGDNPLANAPTQYSADMVITRKTGSSGPPTSMHGPTSMGGPTSMHLYVDGTKRRTDRDINGGIITILRGDLSKSYTLIVSSKTYMEAPLDSRILKSGADLGKNLGIQEKVGTEEVNGELCDKYSLGSSKMPQISTGKMQMPQSSQPGLMNRGPSGFIWVGQSTHMMVKSDNPHYTVEWKNIKLGPPDASVFEVPADYKKVDRPKPAEVKPEEENSGGATPSGEPKSGGESPSPVASPTGEKSD